MAVVKRIKTIFQFRRGTTNEWELNKNITPAAGEPCFNLDTGTLKIGDGITTYENLKVVGGGTLSDDGLLVVENLQSDVEAIKDLIGEVSVSEQISNAMEDVAKSSDLEEAVDNITVLESQVNTVNNTITEIQTVIEQKADVETVSELQTIVETKVDNDAIDKLEKDLKNYVTEQIQLIENGNIDDGEI